MRLMFTVVLRCFLSLCVLILFCHGSDTFAQDHAQFVDPLIGTEQRSEQDGLACGYTYPGATTPFGMVQFTPSFFSPGKGFVINQLSGAGCAHMGNFPLTPIAGRISESPNDLSSMSTDKRIEKAQAGYLAAIMPDNVYAELTAGTRSGVARFIFPDSTDHGSVLIGIGVNSTFVTDAHVVITSENTFEGFSAGGEFCGTKTPYKIFFAAEFDCPALKSGVWRKRKLKKRSKNADGNHSGAWFTFDTEVDKAVQYRIAISYVSISNAKENLLSDGVTLDFDRTRHQAETLWNEALGKIEIKTDDPDKKVQFYTNLYHALIHPNIISDVNGEYMGADFKVHSDPSKPHYTSFSTWDTYRTQAQLLAMLFPEESSDMMQSAVDFADQAGGYGRWILANIETGIMQGDPMAALIANSYTFGARDFDLERAFYHMNRGATIPGLRSQEQEIRPHLSEYLEHGATFASMMLEYTSADFAIGQFALQALGKDTDAEFFFDRAQNWKNIFNPKQNWLNSRYPSGPWKDITLDWREGTYKNYFWMVPYDLHSLIDTIGGKDVAEKRLDSLFLRLDASYDDDWFASGNEPDFQVPWIYNWTNAPWKSSAVIHRILSEMYDSSPSGLPGNDDLGAMGAWYVFASMGLYPMIPGIGGFSVSSPQFQSINIKLPGGDLSLTGGGPGQFIRSMTVNGVDHTSTWLDWKELKSGGNVTYETSGEPDESWGYEDLSDHSATINGHATPRIVFMGNSITEHWPEYDGEFWSDNSRINKGISGQTTGQMLDRFQADVIGEHADMVFILAGTNDIAGNMGPVVLEEIFENIRSMTEMAEKRGIQVLLTSVLPVAEYPWSTGQDPLHKIPALNEMIRNYAEENGIIYVDYFSEMVDDNGGMIGAYAFDGVHPNTEGYGIMRFITLSAIKKAIDK